MLAAQALAGCRDKLVGAGAPAGAGGSGGGGGGGAAQRAPASAVAPGPGEFGASFAFVPPDESGASALHMLGGGPCEGGAPPGPAGGGGWPGGRELSPAEVRALAAQGVQQAAAQQAGRPGGVFSLFAEEEEDLGVEYEEGKRLREVRGAGGAGEQRRARTDGRGRAHGQWRARARAPGRCAVPRECL